MLTPDPDVLLYLHNNPPAQAESVVAPIADALRRQWPGEVVVANLGQVHVWLGPRPRVEIHGRKLLPGRTYARTFTSAHYDTALTRSLAALGSRVVNAPDAVRLANTKFETAAALAAADVPVPQQTLFGSRPHPDDLAAHAELGWPRVIKSNEGMGGDGVWLAQTADAVCAVTDVPGPVRPWVAQWFHAESAGRDLRVLVADGTVLGAVERSSGSVDEFRANVKQGGSVRLVELSETEITIARTAAEVVGLTVAGVDLLRTDRGAVVTEVNANPALARVAQLLGEEQIYDAVAAAVVRA